MKSSQKIALTSALMVALAGCANAQDTSDNVSDDSPRTCMLVRAIDTYRPIDRNHVVIVERGERTFLLGTIQPA